MITNVQQISSSDSLGSPATPGRIVLLVLIVLYLGFAVYSQSIIPLRLTKGTSMEPSLRQGDIILIKKVPFSDIDIGDVIAFRTPEVFVGVSPGTIRHRVVDIGIRDGQMALTTKGDNSDIDPYPVRPSDVRGKAVIRVKYIGVPVVFMTRRQGILFVSIATLLSLLYIPAFIVFYATVIRGGDSSTDNVTALAIRPDAPLTSEARESAVDYSDLRDTLLNLSEKVDRIHTRGVLPVQEGAGKSVAALDRERSAQSNIGVLSPAPSEPDGHDVNPEGSRVTDALSQAPSDGEAMHDGRLKRPTAPTSRTYPKQQAFVSLFEGDSDHIDSTSGFETDSQYGDYNTGHGTDDGSMMVTFDQPEVKLFKQYQSALTQFENTGGTSAESVTDDELQTLVSKVVEMEAPVHILDLRGKIGEYLGVGGGTDALGDRLNTAIKALVSKRKMCRELANGSLSINGQFLTLSTSSHDGRPRRGGNRDIARITDLEVQEGLLAVVWAMYTASPSSLMAETARQFGFARLDVKLSSRLDSSISRLVKDGKISVGNGGILHGR